MGEKVCFCIVVVVVVFGAEFPSVCVCVGGGEREIPLS